MSKLSSWLSRLFKKPATAVQNKAIVDVKGINQNLVGVATSAGASVNFYRSADYQALQAELEKAQRRVKKDPDDLDFRQELAEALQKLEDFKRDVLKLAEDFNKIPINTERLRLAKQYFETGDYKAARAILDAESISATRMHC